MKTDETPVIDISEDVEEKVTDEIVVVNDNPEIENHIEDDTEPRLGQTSFEYAVPEIGEMTFEGDIGDILRSVHRLLEGQNVHLTIKWDVLDKEEKDIPGEINKEKMLKRLQELEKAAKYAVLNEQRRKATGSNG